MNTARLVQDRSYSNPSPFFPKNNASHSRDQAYRRLTCRKCEGPAGPSLSAVQAADAEVALPLRGAEVWASPN